MHSHARCPSLVLAGSQASLLAFGAAYCALQEGLLEQPIAPCPGAPIAPLQAEEQVHDDHQGAVLGEGPGTLLDGMYVSMYVVCVSMYVG